MNRKVTNAIRWVMDECLPPLIRDNKYFMYPFFYIWFKGKNIKNIMSFKSDVYDMTKEEFSEFYRQRTSLAKDRPTDLSEASILYMLERLQVDAASLIDVGCGNGYFLNRVKDQIPKTAGCDVFEDGKLDGSTYVQGDIESLPLADDAYDIVTCHHVLEHVIDLQQSISEIKRVAARQVIVVVPCQRYNYYTLDEHVRFFPYKELLVAAMGMEKYICKKVAGDLVFIGTIQN